MYYIFRKSVVFGKKIWLSNGAGKWTRDRATAMKFNNFRDAVGEAGLYPEAGVLEYPQLDADTLAFLKQVAQQYAYSKKSSNLLVG